MKCFDHDRPLRASPDGSWSCELCGGTWVSGDRLEALIPGARGSLSLETREDSGAFSKPRACLECQAWLVPMRIGQLEGWVEHCESCDRAWVERIDFRSLEMVVKRRARERAFGSMSHHEKKELVSDLAEATAADHQTELTAGQTILTALGIPVLVGVASHRTPLATWGLAVMLCVVWALGVGFPESFAPETLGWAADDEWWKALSASIAHADVLHLLGNVVALLIFGGAVEQRLSRVVLTLSVLLAGPVTLAVERAFSQADLIVGASGAVAVLIGAAVVVQPQAKLAVRVGLPVLVSRLSTVVRVPLPLVGALVVLYQLLMWSLDAPGIAWLAHLAGLGIGLAMGGIARTQRLHP